ncbi:MULTISPECIES: hypothetical protein [unclassified Sphingopyxis]|jgi:hypothetical protein|nr:MULTISPECIES: hypothetical protein [unclassified Sphingopyxis]
MKRAVSRDDGYLALKYEDLKRMGRNNCAVQHWILFCHPGAGRDLAIAH